MNILCFIYAEICFIYCNMIKILKKLFVKKVTNDDIYNFRPEKGSLTYDMIKKNAILHS